MKGIRLLANQAFSRAAGAPLLEGNHVRLLKDAGENYPAWLAAIDAAKRSILFENYIICEDDVGLVFADALIRKARTGVRVRLICDWFGRLTKAPARFWKHLIAGGVDVRCFNPPRLESPLACFSRDHRKTLVVDGSVGFVTGLCIGRMWAGNPDKGIDQWRDTGVEVRGAAVADIQSAFAQMWASMGPPIPDWELAVVDGPEKAGAMSVRVVADSPAAASIFRLDLLVAALARKRLWLTDAYYAGTTPYVQSLQAVAMDGVDVRLLVSHATDVPLLKPLSLAGYRPLLEAGVRVFEWNGTMLHAKTAVADGRWARVGSTNLNLFSWFGNRELDIVVENEPFARQMEAMYLTDLNNATEIVLDENHRVRSRRVRQKALCGRTSGGSGGRATAGMLRIGEAVGSAVTGRRVLGSVEDQLMASLGGLLLALAAIIALFPRILLYPVEVLLVWLGAALLYRGYASHRNGPERRLMRQNANG
jgi:cardiolipin synthase A/B